MYYDIYILYIHKYKLGLSPVFSSPVLYSFAWVSLSKVKLVSSDFVFKLALLANKGKLMTITTAPGKRHKSLSN